MSRTLVDIPPDKLSKLDSIARHQHVSRSFMIRAAIDKLLEEYTKPTYTDKAFGLFKKKKIDSLELQNQLRKDWE